MASDNAILVVDETIREGMQHRGLVFSLEERKTILDFQERLGIDISQAGYPPAHPSEADQVRMLSEHTRDLRYSIQVAGMGRAATRDTDCLISTGVNQFHLHARIEPDAVPGDQDAVMETLRATVETILKARPGAVISLAMLDIGRTGPEVLKRVSAFLIDDLGIDILSLPDTSGMLGPALLHDRIRPIAEMAAGTGTRISAHCHDDMGMASANTVMAVNAGARVIETSVLGIGERNGIADLYTTARVLKDQGFDLALKTDDMDTVKAYYDYVSDIHRNQTGEALLQYRTPFFGRAVKTHVAGTHGIADFGITREKEFFLNLLCGRQLVRQYLEAHGIAFKPEFLPEITRRIKDKSAELGRRVKRHEIEALVAAMESESATHPGNRT